MAPRAHGEVLDLSATPARLRGPFDSKSAHAKKKPGTEARLPIWHAWEPRCYFRLSTCIVSELTVRRILSRSPNERLEASTEPSTCFETASPFSSQPSMAAQFL